MRSQTIIINNEHSQNTEELDFDKTNLKTRNKREIELNSGKEVKYLPPREGVLRGRKPDTVILRCEVSEEFYHSILVPMIGYHGVIIDER